MKSALYIVAIAVIVSLTGCDLTNQGVLIGLPTVEAVCVNAVTDGEVTSMFTRIKGEAFKDDKLARARMVTKDQCFKVSQVITLMGAFSFEDNKLALAKDLYNQVIDKNQYDLVIDVLVHKSNKDELRAYIASH
ncbi:MAG: hypothetical protein ACI9J3_001801 [Parvicellaceae bacterium]|jgi:hypothetical protein